jgi:hypothetical protein
MLAITRESARDAAIPKAMPAATGIIAWRRTQDSPETVDQVWKEELHGVPLLKKDTFREAAALPATSSSNPMGGTPRNPSSFLG